MAKKNIGVKSMNKYSANCKTSGRNISLVHIGRLIRLERCRLLRRPWQVLSLLLLASILLLGVRFLSHQPVKRQTIAVINQDQSAEVKLLLTNLAESKLDGSVQLRYMDQASAIQALDNQQVMAVIRVPERTVERLNQGQPADIILTVGRQTWQSQFLIEYLQTMVNLFNEAQTEAINYWQALRENKELTSADRAKAFNRLSSQILLAFMTRTSVFNLEKGINPTRTNDLIYVFWLVVVVLTVFFSYGDDVADCQTQRRRRLYEAGYRPIEWRLASLVVVVLLSWLALAVTWGMIQLILPASSVALTIRQLIILTFWSLMVHLIYQFGRLIRLGQPYQVVVIIVLLISLSNRVISRGKLPNAWRWIVDYNPVSLICDGLKGYPLLFGRGIGLLIWALVFLFGRFWLFNRRRRLMINNLNGGE